MAASDKDIVISPQRGSTTNDPSIVFTGDGNDPISVNVLDSTTGSLSFEGSAGQLFSISNNLTSGSIFSVNDVSGIPSLDINADGTILLAEFSGNVGIGTDNPNYKLQVEGDIKLADTGTIWFDDTSTTIEKIKAESGSIDLYADSEVRFFESDAGTEKVSVDVNNARIFFQGDDNTYWHRPAADTHAFTTNGTERLRLDSDGRLLLRSGTNTSTDRAGGFHNALQVEGTSATSSSVAIIRNSNDVNSPYLNFGKSRGTSVGSNTIVNSNDTLAIIDFTGSDGSGSFNSHASIRAYVDGAPGNGDSPGKITFWTTPDNSNSPSERLTIKSNGNIGIGTDNPSQKLDVRGNLVVGGSTTSNYIAFQGTTGDLPSSTRGFHSFIGERIYGGTEQSELLILKDNDAEGSNVGPDRVRIVGANIQFDTYNANNAHANFEAAATDSNNTLALLIDGSGNVGINKSDPGAKLHVHGTAIIGGTNNSTDRRADFDTDGRLSLSYGDNSNNSVLTLKNTNTAASTGHGANILWQFGTNASSTAISAGRIDVIKEQQWTSTASTQDSALSINLTQNGTLGEKVHIASDGTVSITGGTNVDGYQYRGDNVKTASLFVRGTGLNHSSYRHVYLNGTRIVNTNTRGLTLTIIGAGLTHVSSTNYDTYDNTTNSDNLATAISSINVGQIGVLSSYDAWELYVNNNLRTAALRVGLTKLGTYSAGSSRRPYAAVFYGTSDDVNGRPRDVIERMEDNDGDSPEASIFCNLATETGAGSMAIPGAISVNALYSAQSTTEGPVVVVDSDDNVGIGSLVPIAKLDVNGSLKTDAYAIWTETPATGTGGSNGGVILKTNPNQSSSDLNGSYIYRVRAVVKSTGTDTGATWLVYYKESSSAYEIRLVNRSGTTSNHPRLRIAGQNNNQMQLYTTHQNSYTVRVITERFYTDEPDSTLHAMGSDYHWQRSINDLYYLDGDVGIGTDNPGQKLDVIGGNIRVGKTSNGQFIGENSSGTVKIKLDTDGDSHLSGGKLCIAHTSVLHSGNLQVSTSGADAIDINSYSSSGDNGGRLSFYRSKNATIGSNTIVVDDDSLGRIDFRGYNSNGNSYNQGATIEARVDGSVNSTTDMPTAILFKTSADGSSSPTERLRITSAGDIGINSTSPNAQFVLSRDLSTNHGIEMGYSSGGGGLHFIQAYNRATSAFTHLKLNNSLSITSDGKIGIGTANPDGLLTIKGNSDEVSTPSIRLLDGTDTREVSITNTAGDFVVSTHGTDDAIHGRIKIFESGIIAFDNGGASGSLTEKLRITSDGTIQLSNLASAYTSGTATRFSLYNDTNNHYGLHVGVSFDLNYNAGGSVASGKGEHVFHTAAQERFRIHSDGLIEAKTRSAEVRRMILSGSPDNAAFNIEAHDGESGTSSGDVQGKLGLFYNDGTTLTNTANISFERGSGASDGAMAFITNQTERLRITSDGDVGIGVINPGAKLEVNVGSAVTAFDIQGSAGQLFSVTNNLSSGSIFSVNDVSGIPSIDVDADGTILLAEFSGDVGIGTDNPTSKLDVNGTVTAPTFYATVGTFAAGNDTQTDAAIVIKEEGCIYTKDGVYLRTLIEKKSDVIIIGQQNTALIDNIELKPGTTGGRVKLHAGGTSDNVKLETTASGVTVTGSATATTFESTQATGTAPFTVASTTKVTNLNADTLDGIEAANFLKSNQSDTMNGVLTVGGSSVSGGEGGELQLTYSPNTTLSGSTLNIDLQTNVFRVFEGGSPNKGAYIALANCDSSVGSEILHSGSGAQTKTGNLTLEGDVIIDTNTNSKFLYISRTGSTTDEFTRIGRDDTITHFYTKNDEATSTIRFRIQNTDVAGGQGGANANDRNIDLISDGTDARITIAGNKVFHDGYHPDADKVKIVDSSSAVEKKIVFVDDQAAENNYESIEIDSSNGITYNPSSNSLTLAGDLLFTGFNIKTGVTSPTGTGSNNYYNEDITGSFSSVTLIEESADGGMVFKSNGGGGAGAIQFYDAGWRPKLKVRSGNNNGVEIFHGEGGMVMQTTDGFAGIGVTVFGDLYVGDGNNSLTPPENSDGSGSMYIAGDLTVSGTCSTLKSKTTSFNTGSDAPGFHFDTNGVHKMGRNTSASNSALRVFGGSGEFKVKGDGSIVAGGSNFGGASDINLKENIVDANSQWDDIKDIRVRNFNFKSSTGYSTHRQIGVIAQEIELVSPGLVNDINEEDNDGNITDTTKSVAYSVLYMKAVKALQEAMERIETLEAKVAALESGN